MAQIIGADILILFSDVDGLYDRSKSKKIVREVTTINEKIMSMIDNKKNEFGSGSIATKLDATVIFSLTGDKRDLGRKLTYEDLKIENPYNTYKNFGLPPGPISYVGHKTIELIFEDYKTDYLFYFYNSIENRHIFSLNYKDHLIRLNEYRSN